MHLTMHDFLQNHRPSPAVPLPRSGGDSPSDDFESESTDPDLHAIGGKQPDPALAVGPTLGSPERNTCLHEAAERLSTALFHVVHQPTAKGRDRSLAALIALIYGPTPFGGVNSLRDVAMRYGMSEQHLFQLMRVHRNLLAGALDPEYEI